MVLKYGSGTLSVKTPNPDEARRARLLNIILLALIVATLVSLVLLFLFIPTGLAGSMEELMALFAAAIFLLIMSSIIFVIKRRVSVDFAAALLIITTVIVASISDTPEQVVNGRGLIVFAIPIIMASFTLRPSGSFVAATLSSLVMVLLSYQIGGVLPNFFGMIGFYLLALLTWLASRNLESALDSLRKANRALAESEYIARMERERADMYLDIMSHDIGNKHQAIMLATDLLATSVENDTLQEALNKIPRAIEVCSSLRGQVQKIEGLYSEPLEQVSLVAQVKKKIREFSTKNPEVSVIYHGPQRNCFILADKYLGELVSSLLSNTVKHNPNNRLTVWISIRNAGGSWFLSVADDGTGIEPSRKDSLFDPDRRFGGVGLHIARRIVNKYGGQIQVQNRVPDDPSQGAEFEVIFPATHRGKLDAPPIHIESTEAEEFLD